ncbi:heterokaryon incompatibility protein-domain-containing protein [Hypoxylon crocopeplum]|nr:heterokaryon incompatibility protein-domain-containing protein [Hypoxylon crocopeplum]
MRLLHSCSGEMREFLSYADIPPYAILSHTWGDDEVSFQDWTTVAWPEVRRKRGLQKIEYCRQQAAKDGFEWVWVDTCCINNTSSAELTESINSMFQWYKNAEVCYAYLSDVPKDSELSTTEEELAESRWFTRGWTLQELIAPSEVVFYSKNWKQVGTKSELSSCIAGITGIEEAYLNGADIQSASVAQRMSWAARRQTSRNEDVAYCLLGIFDVNMPLIYGEGLKSFQRLQEEIMKAYPEDHTLFAWGTVVTSFSKWVKTDAQKLGREPLEYEPEKVESVLGLLAQSPKDFEQSGKFVCYTKAKRFFRRWDILLTAPACIGRMTRLDLPLNPDNANFAVCHLDSLPTAQLRSVKMAVLVCGRQDEVFKFVTLPLLVCTGGYYGRTREVIVNDWIAMPRINFTILGQWRQQLLIERQPKYRPRTGDIILRRFVPIVRCPMSIEADNIEVAIDDGFIKALAPTQGRIACLTFDYNSVSGLALVISRMGESENGTGNLHFALLPVDITVPAWEVTKQYKLEVEEVNEDSDNKNEDSKNEGETTDKSEHESESEGKGEAEREGNEEEAETKVEAKTEAKTEAEAEEAKEEQSNLPPISKLLPSQFQTTFDAYHWLWDHWQEAPYKQEMPLTSHTWEVAENWRNPTMRITAERIYIDDDPEQPVDIVDIVMESRYVTN